jgi:hypothetical protein
MKRRHWLAFTLCLAVNAHSLGADVESLTVNTPNALLTVAKQLGRLYGCGVSYEGPMYEHVDDLVDTIRLAKPIAEWVEDCGDLSRINARFCYFTARYDVEPITREPKSIVLAVRQIVEQYNAGGNPGRFMVIETSAGPSVVASEVRSPSGEWKNVTPVLSHPISLSITNATNTESLYAVLTAVEGASGVRVVGGSLKQGRGRISLRADNEPARDVLARLLSHPEYGGTNNAWFVIQSTCPRLCGFEEHSTVKSPPLRARDDLPWSMIGNVTHPNNRREPAQEQ